MKDKDIETLMKIKTAADIKTVEVEEYFTDDHQQCATVEVNGAKIEFLWHDNLGFLEYWKDSAKAAKDLVDNIKHTLNAFCIEERIIDGTATVEMYQWAYAYDEEFKKK
jgi:hypothetical protein